MTGEISGLAELLKVEIARNLRIQKRRKGLELDLERFREEAAKALADERVKHQSEINELQQEKDDLSAQMLALQETVKRLEDEIIVEHSANLSLKCLKDELLGKLSAAEITRTELEKQMSDIKSENDSLRSALAAVPSREVVVADFRGSDEYKREVVDARVAAVDAYKGSEEFDEELKAAVECGVLDFKASTEYAGELARVQDVALSQFKSSAAFKEAVGVEAGKMSKRIVDCCREFFKGGLHRPTQEFGAFFVEFVRRTRGSGSSGQSPGGSGARSSTT